METATAAGGVGYNASDSESPALPEAGFVKDKIGRFTENERTMISGNSTNTDPRDRILPPLWKASHDPVADGSQKPPIPRKPTMLTSTELPVITKPPLRKRTPSPAPPQKHPPFINELMEINGGVQLPKPDRYNNNQPSPPSDNFRPQLPPRTGTSNSERSSSSLKPVSSRQSPLSYSDHKPKLPPRQNSSPISRVPMDNQRIVLQDNESPYQLLDENSSNLVEEPGTMVEQPPDTVRISLSAPDGAALAKKVPPPPPRQRRAGPPPVSKLERMGRTTSYTTPEGARPTPYRPTSANGQKSQVIQGNEISKKEQSRYEAVWAANKGILIPGPTEPFYNMYPPGASEMVLNLVVRDIWSRSRLPNDVLQQIWDLVDRRNVRLLTKDEFMVGMWLIDRKLEGNQLPGKVPVTVWNSMKRSSSVEPL